ncbi:peptidylprolyl isomerase [Verrucomicrobiota bacterium]
MKTLTKKAVFTIIFVLISFIANTEEMLIDGIAARVNGKIITVGDVLMTLRPVQRQLAGIYRGDELRAKLKEAYKKALNTLIAKQLILDYYEKQKVFIIPEWMVDERVERIVRDMFQGDRGKMLSALTKEDIDYDQWRNEIRDHVIIFYMRKMKVDDHVSISPQTIREIYEKDPDNFKIPEKVKLRMIVINKSLSDRDNREKQLQAWDIRNRLIAGEDFAALAKQLSEGSKAKAGGDWGWIELTMLRPELSEAVTFLKSGQTSKIIETEEELYILRIEGRTNETMAPFKDIQPRIEAKLRREEVNRLYEAWINRLEEEARIDVADIDSF